MKPLVSVIMPSYNAERYIGEAIESILCQSYSNWELIIVEDCSTDSTLDVIKTYHDNRIKVLCNSSNVGVAETTNKAMKESSGKYIALLDDDDVAEKHRLLFQVNYLEQHSEIDVLGGRTTYIDSRGTVISRSGIPRYNPKYIKAVLLFNCMDFMNSTAMIRREFIEKNHLYYHNGCYGMQDFRFYIESSKVGNISTIEEFLLKHRLYEGNATKKNMSIFHEERRKVYAELQRYSLKRSGFQLSEEELDFVNKAFPETGGTCDSKGDLLKLYEIFRKLLEQGEKMNIDYYEELSHLCRKKIADRMISIKNLFE